MPFPSRLLLGRPRRPVSLASCLCGWLIILGVLPLGLVGVTLLIPFLAAVTLGARMGGLDD